MSHVLLWQPSECLHLIVNCVLFSENKYDDDDDDDDTECCRCAGQVLLLDRCNSLLLPFSAVGCHPHVDAGAEIVVGASSAYVLHRRGAGSCREDLHAYVRRRRRLTEREAARLFAQALQAVAHCHRHSVVVRDVKLRRFLFADDDRCLIQQQLHIYSLAFI